LKKELNIEYFEAQINSKVTSGIVNKFLKGTKKAPKAISGAFAYFGCSGF